MKNQSILVFGGSFDPPHKCHIQLLKQAVKELNLQKTIIFPAYLSPFKDKHISPYKYRKKMISILLSRLRIKAKIDDFEFKKGRKTYTYEIGKYLVKKYPEGKFFFLLGSDSYNNIKKWKNYDKLKETFHFVVGIREGFPLKRKKNPDIVILKKRFKNISSTDIRNKLLVSDYRSIDKAIKKYIFKKGLYYSNLIFKIKKILGNERFFHTISTTKLALSLSAKYKLDPVKTFLASILHDISKRVPIKKQITDLKNMRIKNYEKAIKLAPQILHQWHGALVANKKFKIKDKEILSAISKHATGAKKMSLLDKIIYVSDYACYDRSFKEAAIVRKKAFENIHQAYTMARRFKKEYIKKIDGYFYG
ncbi:MAG: nicotinate (nicotinamide) nucleotide adenylyltransferase [Elusimicrobiota bacterium]